MPQIDTAGSGGYIEGHQHVSANNLSLVCTGHSNQRNTPNCLGGSLPIFSKAEAALGGLGSCDGCILADGVAVLNVRAGLTSYCSAHSCLCRRPIDEFQGSIVSWVCMGFNLTETQKIRQDFSTPDSF
jgi:hypothetical protein